MTTRTEQQARYWLTEKGWAAAARCVSPAATTTPTKTEPTHQENPRD